MLQSDSERIRVLLVKPYQPVSLPVFAPPLGILTLASTLREHFGKRVEVRAFDHWIDKKRYFDLEPVIEEFRPHVVGLSALNVEAEESGRIADLVKRRWPGTVTALGGPFAHGEMNRKKIEATGIYDWIFDGEADLSFPIAVERWLLGDRRLDDIVGLTWRNADQGYVTNGCAVPGGRPMVGAVQSLDDLPFPAWDLVDFDAYARGINNNGNLRGTRYAPIFTSRGCPYLCTYCHDIFGKKFRHRSPANVIEEVRLLQERYGVDELHIVDDIFNLHAPRMKEICRGITPFKMNMVFPNGLRGDILDEEGVQALVDAGMYEVAVAIETVTPRLQDMVKKRLRLDRLLRAVEWMTRRGVMVKGFFMLGFPTETVKEMQDTIDFAIKSELTHGVFNLVTPQPGTPLYEEAYKASPEALEKMILHDYSSAACWYQEAYGVDMHEIYSKAYFRFYTSSPKRIWRLLRYMSVKDFTRGLYYWAEKVLVRKDTARSLDETLPDTLKSLRKVYNPDMAT